MRIKCCIDWQELSSKPNKYGIGAIKKRLHEQPREVDLQTLANMVGIHGQTFYSGVMKGMNNEDWQSQQLIVLDYDDGAKFLDVLNVFNSLGLEPTFAYKTLSYTSEHEKYRVIFALNEPINDSRVALSIMSAMCILSENKGYKVDKASKVLAQQWLGGKGLLYTNFNARLNIKALFNELITDCSSNQDGNGARRLKKLAKDLGVNTINGLPQIVESECYSNTERIIATLSPEERQEIEKRVNSKIDVLIPTSIITIIESGTKTSKNAFTQYDGFIFDFGKTNDKGKSVVTHDKTDIPRPVRCDFKGVMDSCQLLTKMVGGEHYNEFIEGTHDHFFGLATNIHNLEGAEEVYKTIINAYPYSNKDNKLNALVVSRKNNYHAKPCESFCPYHSECGSYNVISCLNGSKRLGVKKVADIPTVSLEEGREQLNVIIDGVMGDMMDKDGIHLVKVPTGVGKTYKYTKSDLDGLIIATPNHELANEFMKRRGTTDIHYVKELNTDNMPKAMVDNINMCYTLGQSVYRYLSDLMAATTSDKNDLLMDKALKGVELMKLRREEWQDEDLIKQVEEELKALELKINLVQAPAWYDDAKEYLDNIDKMKDCTSMLMTHKRLSYISKLDNLNIHTMVIDEDPFECFLAIEQISYTRLLLSLIDLVNTVFVSDELSHLLDDVNNAISFLRDLKEGELLSNPLNNLSKQTIKEIKNAIMKQAKIDFNVGTFFSMKYLTRLTGEANDVLVGLNDRFSTLPNMKVVILSATIDFNIWEQVVNKFAPHRRVYKHEVQEVKYKGELILQSGKTYSRSSVDDVSYISDLQQKWNINNVVTYKKMTKTFKDLFTDTNINFRHFGKNMGFDGWNGQDLISIGTPSRPSYVYDLYGYAITGQKPISDKWEVKKITRHGFEFPLNTYSSDDDEYFTNIQLYFLYTELAQTVGRARLVSNNCKVVTICNLPLPQCKIINSYT